MTRITKKYLLLLLLIITLSPWPTTAAEDSHEYKTSFYNILSLIQNNYIVPTENWNLINGAITGLEEILSPNGLKKQESAETLTLTFPSGRDFIVKEQEITDNAYMMIEKLSGLCINIAKEFPNLGRQEIIHAAIRGVVSTLDSHSSFVTAEEFSVMREKNKGVFGGIGVELTIKDDALTVVSPLEGTPAYFAGLQANDWVLAIDEEPTDKMSLLLAVAKIRGTPGTEVQLTVMRAGWDKPKIFTIARQTTTIHSIRSRIVEPGFLYLQIVSFISTSSEDARRILVDSTQQDEIKGLILDLRNNPGGLLEQSEDIADMFLDQGMIVSSKGQNRDQNIVFKAHRDRLHFNFPIVILINEGSASGAEIVTAALKENNKALILGNRTFGKGTIQTIFPVMAGDALRITTAEFFTPGGSKIEKVGIPPQLMIKTAKKQQKNEPKTALPDSGHDHDIPTITLADDSGDSILRLAVDLLKCAPLHSYGECINIAVSTDGRMQTGNEKPEKEH